MGLMSLKRLLKDNNLTLKDLEEKLRVYFEVKKKFDKDLSDYDDENHIIRIVKENSGSTIKEIYKLTQKAFINCDSYKFNCVIREALERGKIGRKYNILY